MPSWHVFFCSAALQLLRVQVAHMCGGPVFAFLDHSAGCATWISCHAHNCTVTSATMNGSRALLHFHLCLSRFRVCVSANLSYATHRLELLLIALGEVVPVSVRFVTKTTLGVVRFQVSGSDSAALVSGLKGRHWLSFDGLLFSVVVSVFCLCAALDNARQEFIVWLESGTQASSLWLNRTAQEVNLPRQEAEALRCAAGTVH